MRFRWNSRELKGCIGQREYCRGHVLYFKVYSLISRPFELILPDAGSYNREAFQIIRATLQY